MSSQGNVIFPAGPRYLTGKRLNSSKDSVQSAIEDLFNPKTSLHRRDHLINALPQELVIQQRYLEYLSDLFPATSSDQINLNMKTLIGLWTDYLNLLPLEPETIILLPERTEIKTE